MTKRIFGFMGAVIFALFAVVQLNDPDPLRWVINYGVMALVCLVVTFRQVPKEMLWVLSSLMLLQMCWLIPQVAKWMNVGMPSITEKMKAESPHIEFMREFFGLVICFSTLIFILRKQKPEIKAL